MSSTSIVLTESSTYSMTSPQLENPPSPRETLKRADIEQFHQTITKLGETIKSVKDGRERVHFQHSLNALRDETSKLEKAFLLTGKDGTIRDRNLHLNTPESSRRTPPPEERIDINELRKKIDGEIRQINTEISSITQKENTSPRERRTSNIFERFINSLPSFFTGRQTFTGTGPAMARDNSDHG